MLVMRSSLARRKSFNQRRVLSAASEAWVAFASHVDGAECDHISAPFTIQNVDEC